MNTSKFNYKNVCRIPCSNVQHGVLKALTFLFEYIGEKSTKYINTLYSLLENTLIDRDGIHKQIASWAVKNLALGCYGRGFDDVLLSLLNFIWPNLLRSAAHLSLATMDAIDALRLSVGPGTILYYTLQGLFHSSKRVSSYEKKSFR